MAERQDHCRGRGLAAACTPAGAQDWPAWPLTMVYPFAAGSAADALGRMFASRLSEIFS